MFFKSKHHITINPDLVKSGNFPLLVKNREWNNMTATIQNKKMKHIAQKIHETIRDMEKAKNEAVALKKKKKELTHVILESSFKINEGNESEEKLHLLEKNKNELKKTANDLDAVYEAMESLPEQINTLNLELLEETASQIYGELIEHDHKNQKLDKQVKQLREELNQLRENKEKIVVQLETWYSFLHHLIGPKEMEKLDKQIAFQPQPENESKVIE